MTEKFVQDALKAHNDYRKRHNVPTLSYSKDVTAMAQRWAEHLASTGQFQHSSERSYKGETMGENIAMKWTSGGEDFTGQQVTNQWYTEVSKFDYNHGGGSGTGHFTQIVWKDSKKFGMGRAKGRDGKWIVVGNYVPAGNMMGKYRENVFPPKDGNTSLMRADEKSGASAKKEMPGHPDGVRVSSGSDNHFSSGFSSGFKGFPDSDNHFSSGFSSGFKGFSDSGMDSAARGRQHAVPPSSSKGGQVVSRRTKTVTEGTGANKKTTTIVTEEILQADGSKKSVTTETVTTGN